MIEEESCIVSLAQIFCCFGAGLLMVAKNRTYLYTWFCCGRVCRFHLNASSQSQAIMSATASRVLLKFWKAYFVCIELPPGVRDILGFVLFGFSSLTRPFYECDFYLNWQTNNATGIEIPSTIFVTSSMGKLFLRLIPFLLLLLLLVDCIINPKAG